MIYAIDYFGFVYQWFDNKRKMWYIGSHHGPLDDGYICSSQQMRRAFKRRPADFTRTILEFNRINDCNITLQLEQKYLDKINNIKDDPRYYNKKNEAEGGWSFISKCHVDKRAKTLRSKHNKSGLSKKERESYRKKIETRLTRIAKSGFTEKEIEQHNSYGYECKVILPTGEEKIYPSMVKASKDLKIDCQYARLVTLQNRSYKGYQVFMLSEPKIDCRAFKR